MQSVAVVHALLHVNNAHKITKSAFIRVQNTSNQPKPDNIATWVNTEHSAQSQSVNNNVSAVSMAAWCRATF